MGEEEKDCVGKGNDDVCEIHSIYYFIIHQKIF